MVYNGPDFWIHDKAKYIFVSKILNSLAFLVPEILKRTSPGEFIEGEILRY